MSSILIANALLVTMNSQREVYFGNLLVEDDRIKAIGRQEYAADRVIDARGRVVIPGLIQTHVHLCQSLFRGQADDLELLDWLRRRIWPLEAAHDPESVYISALLGIGEMFRCGTTAINDMETVRHTESAFEAIAAAGIRAISGKCMMDWGEAVPSALLEQTDASLQESVDLLEKWHGKCRGRISYAFNPRFAVSCTENLLKQVGDLSRKYRVKVHTHASENRGEIALVERERGMRNIEYFRHLGLAGADLILAHCVWLSGGELEILRKHRIKAVHCPSSNLKLASGIAPVPKMLGLGIPVSLGADGAPCNNNLDPFTEMRLAALIQKPLHGPRVMPAQTVFEMATLGGAEALGLADAIGSLEPGKKADLALMDMGRLHCAPFAGGNIYGKLVYQARGTDVTLTMVDGRVVYENGRLATIDEEDIIRKAGESIERLGKRVGI
jgi:5-methylthioadenosine/S-adenosylhomocysteine deaminase